MRTLFTTITLVAFAVRGSSAEVKEIPVPAMKIERATGRFDHPKEIKSAGELAKAFTQKEVIDSIQKKVDFAKQRLIYFAWSGSGQDSITASEAKGVIVFTYTLGRTRDLRSHFKLFVVDKDATIRVDGAGP